MILRKNYAYMIRNDGKIFEFKGWHPYIKQTQNDDSIQILKFTLTENFEYVKWLYDNTLNNSTKENIIRLLKSFMATTIGDILGKGIYDINSNYVKKYFPDLKYDKDDFTNEQLLFDELNLLDANMNQEFLRFRVAGKYNSESNSNNIYFRIGSIQFNWFNIIWSFVYEHKSQIANITIATDDQAGKPNLIYKYNNQIMDHISVDDFLTLKGNPVFESLDMSVNILQNKGGLFEAYPSNAHWLVKIIKDRREKYIEENFIKL